MNLLSDFGARLTIGNEIACSPPPFSLHSMQIDAGQIPDLVPILAVAAAFAQGETRIYNAARLRIKECDRLAAICSELKKLGADITEEESGLIINGKEYLNGGVCDGWNDHRIVMALSIAAIRCKDTVTITGSNAISKSYPNFFEHYKMLGGEVREFNLGK
jgi:3-phosphoshikimate 1-carboxyvinyltransferase